MHLLKTHSFALALVNRFPSTLWQEALTKLSGPQTKRRHGRRRETCCEGFLLEEGGLGENDENSLSKCRELSKQT